MLVVLVDPVLVVPVDPVLVVPVDVVLEVPTVNLVAENATCCGFKSAIWPVVASLGTVIAICVSLVTLTIASCAEPIHAVVSPVNPEPVTVITVPAAPLLGVIFKIYGCA